MKLRWKILFATAVVLLPVSMRLARAQDSGPAAKTVTLYVDRKTKQVFLEPGRNRLPIKLLGELDTNALADQVEQRVTDKTHKDVLNTVAQTQAQETAQRQALEQQVADMRPAWNIGTGAVGKACAFAVAMRVQSEVRGAALKAGNFRPKWSQPNSGTRDERGRAPRITAECGYAQGREQADRCTG